jgi:peptidoglycan/LPS O-acetylase OafA/YrhL
MATLQATRTRHYPALDGLRAIAIIGVLALHYLVRSPIPPKTASHYLLEVISYGEYGVDLFFVLSGFLITGILLGSRDSPSYFRTFYIRRALRIFPLYYLLLFVVTFVVPVLAPNAFGTVSGPHMSVSWFWVYLANWPLAKSGWGVSPPALDHFWTLAMEEQFYLVWPAVVYTIPRRHLIGICALVVCASILLRAVLVYHWPVLTVIPLNTLARLDGLAMGAIIAVWWSSEKAVGTWGKALWPSFITVAGGLVMLRIWRGPLHLDDKATLIVGLPMICAAFASMLGIVLLQEPRARIASALAAPWLRWIGRYSYGLYVIHYPVLIAFNTLGLTYSRLLPRLHSVALAGIIIVVINAGATATAAFISWRFLEEPILKLKDRYTYTRRVPAV